MSQQRFDFAYQPLQALVVRGGWGMFYSNREQNDQERGVSPLDLPQKLILSADFDRHRRSEPQFAPARPPARTVR